MEGSIRDVIDSLTPTQFENLTYDCLRACGLKNLTWRTPGSDGGRDIEGYAFAHDLSGHETIAKWYVECKRYSNSIDWPTVWKKISYADVQEADVLLISTNNNPSPQCETQVSDWNRQRRRPSVRFWRGYDLPRIIRTYPHVASTYGLMLSHTVIETSALQLAMIITKITQSAYVASELGQEYSQALEAAACLSELLSERLDDLKVYQKLVPRTRVTDPTRFEWAVLVGDARLLEDVGFFALLALFRYQTRSISLNIVIEGRKVTVNPIGPKLQIVQAGMIDLDTTAHWARAEVRLDHANNTTLHINQRD